MTQFLQISSFAKLPPNIKVLPSAEGHAYVMLEKMGLLFSQETPPHSPDFTYCYLKPTNMY